MSSPLHFQHVNVKLLASEGPGVDLQLLIPIFHGWIRDRVFDELLLDVADYRHVPEGPGVVAIGHQANYSVDNTDGRLGVRYNRKAVLDGSNADRLVQAARAALAAFQTLESDPALKGALRFGGRDVEVFINDRALAPNSDATRAAARPDFAALFSRLFGGAEYTLLQETEPRRLFGVRARTSKIFTLAELLANLGS